MTAADEIREAGRAMALNRGWLGPEVAEAVAAWLLSEANEPEVEVGDGVRTGGPDLMALRVARAYVAAISPRR